MNRVAIYGAGDYGKGLYKFLKKIDCPISFFIQSEVAEAIECEGKKVISFYDFISMQENYIILLAINNPQAVREIISKFMKFGYSRNMIYDCREFITSNYINIAEKKLVTGEKECVICKCRVKEFKPGGISSGLFEKMKIIGGGYRYNAVCPCCNSLDRNRWVYWILENTTDIFWGENNVLHFAPEKGIEERLMHNPLCDYYAGDIVKKRGNHKIDVTDIPYRDNFFDYIIINHVLEHVQNEKKAFSELRRVLKKTGKLVLSFPIAPNIDTFEQQDVVSDEERLQLYGQKDHIRLYGKDYKNRVENYGFRVKEYIPEKILNESSIQKYGFIKNDILLVCEMR